MKKIIAIFFFTLFINFLISSLDSTIGVTSHTNLKFFYSPNSKYLTSTSIGFTHNSIIKNIFIIESILLFGYSSYGTYQRKNHYYSGFNIIGYINFKLQFGNDIFKFYFTLIGFTSSFFMFFLTGYYKQEVPNGVGGYFTQGTDIVNNRIYLSEVGIQIINLGFDIYLNKNKNIILSPYLNGDLILVQLFYWDIKNLLFLNFQFGGGISLKFKLKNN